MKGGQNKKNKILVSLSLWLLYFQLGSLNLSRNLCKPTFETRIKETFVCIVQMFSDKLINEAKIWREVGLITLCPSETRTAVARRQKQVDLSSRGKTHKLHTCWRTLYSSWGSQCPGRRASALPGPCRTPGRPCRIWGSNRARRRRSRSSSRTRWCGCMSTASRGTTPNKKPTHTRPSRSAPPSCTWPVCPADQTSAPSLQAGRQWRWGRQGCRNWARRRPCRGRGCSKPPSRVLASCIRQDSQYSILSSPPRPPHDTTLPSLRPADSRSWYCRPSAAPSPDAPTGIRPTGSRPAEGHLVLGLF